METLARAEACCHPGLCSNRSAGPMPQPAARTENARQGRPPGDRGITSLPRRTCRSTTTEPSTRPGYSGCAYRQVGESADGCISGCFRRHCAVPHTLLAIRWYQGPTRRKHGDYADAAIRSAMVKGLLSYQSTWSLTLFGKWARSEERRVGKERRYRSV